MTLQATTEAENTPYVPRYLERRTWNVARYNNSPRILLCEETSFDG